MKEPIFAASAFLLILAVLIVHTVFLTAGTSSLLDALQALPSEESDLFYDREAALDAVDAIGSMWDRIVPVLSYTVSYAQIDRADEAISELQVAVQCADAYAYLAARAKGIDTVSRMHMLQSVSLGGIF